MEHVTDIFLDEDNIEVARLEFSDKRSVEYNADQLDMIEHAYATTVHKSQGSEYPVVIIPWLPRKYMWLSSVNYHMGASSGSPTHLAGNPGERIVYITEGPLKGDLAYALSGRTFCCVPGANQYANLPIFLQQMKALGSRFIYEAYDMDKLLKPVCRGDYNEKCIQCENYKKNWKEKVIPCEKKLTKRKNIQRGCSKLAEISRELQLEGKSLTWDTDADGDWAEHVKGVDDYLVALQKAKEQS